ncbi:hypothetical protein N7504_008980 [Penicillium tannophilum]|nr:hypothetical protein N7504_008980 [Penicillium tannophilum]
MKLFLTIATIFAASAATKYGPGQDCRTNKGCDENCVGSKWSVVIEAGDARMVCDPSTLDSTRYVAAACILDDRTDMPEKEAKTVCDNMEGVFCSDYCYLKTLASEEEDLTNRFRKQCDRKDSDGDKDNAIVHVYPTKEEAVNSDGNCDVSVFS